MSEDEKIFAELVNYVVREIPIICVYDEEDVDMYIGVSSSRSVPVNIVNNSIENTVNNSIEDTVNNLSETTVHNSIGDTTVNNPSEDPTDETANTSNSTQALPKKLDVCRFLFFGT